MPKFFFLYEAMFRCENYEQNSDDVLVIRLDLYFFSLTSSSASVIRGDQTDQDQSRKTYWRRNSSVKKRGQQLLTDKNGVAMLPPIASSCGQWCGLRSSSLRTRPVWDQTKSVLVLALVLQVWYCFVKNDLVTLVVIMILKVPATFQVLFIVSLFSVWNITAVEINSGVHLLKR